MYCTSASAFPNTLISSSIDSAFPSVGRLKTAPVVSILSITRPWTSRERPSCQNLALNFEPPAL
jgi:hypothetical protein